MLSSTEGVSFTWITFWGIFLFINLSLSYRAHRLQPSRITKQTLIVYITWTILMLMNVAVFLYKDTGIWNEIDSLTALSAALGIVATLVVARRNHLPFSDPIVRGYLAIFFKGLPQLTLAYSIWQYGGTGISGIAIWVSHLTICTRLAQVLLSLREAGWDRNRKGTLISEIANEASWIVVTVVWLLD